MLDLQKYIQNALKDRFNSNLICWASDVEKSDHADVVLNITSKDHTVKDFDDTIRKFCQQSNSFDENVGNNSNIELVNYLKDNMEIYLPMKKRSKRVMDESKTYFEYHNPDLLVLFNSPETALGEFPPMMREFAEVIH